MKKIICTSIICLLGFFCQATTITVSNEGELKVANSAAKPGDVIILKNGTWNNIHMSLDCTGTASQPITFKAEKNGKVLISGNSSLSLGGSFLVIQGLYFVNGYSGQDAIISFCTDKKHVANNCRVTNTVINDFNNAKRMEENHWVLLYGKNNRLDHCNFSNKKNMGVLLAVILDDERSRENFHSIDHNYFGFRLPLASNTGETIRVGVSQHCEFNSNTQITDNTFEHCDGETEIISLKSGSNVVRNNLFKECQGSVVFRHGNYNTVEHNLFYGNNKDGSGGVRIINKGQWVVNNYFYKCRGAGFRSPLSVMNGVPNSPAFRYVAVTDAVIANNIFLDCAPGSLCEGSDTERSVVPHNVAFLNNLFINSRDSILYNAFDDISGFRFSGNAVSNNIKQPLPEGFHRVSNHSAALAIMMKNTVTNNFILDSINTAGKERLKYELTAKAGSTHASAMMAMAGKMRGESGVNWMQKNTQELRAKAGTAFCKTSSEIVTALSAGNSSPVNIILTGTNYTFIKPLLCKKDVVFTSAKKNSVKFVFANDGEYLLQLQAGNSMVFRDVVLDLEKCGNFISTDTSGSSNHVSLQFINSNFLNAAGYFFRAARFTVSDSVIINNCLFQNCMNDLFNFSNETAKGLYSVERLTIKDNRFINCRGQLLTLNREGNDESTMGPSLTFNGNLVVGCNSGQKPLIHLFGTQISKLTRNLFRNCNAGGILLLYEDLVKADHNLTYNDFRNCGSVVENKFVTVAGNSGLKAVAR